MRNRENHLGTGYEVWTDQQTWFWFVKNPDREGGTIGAAATEAEAVREAWSSIEELGGAIAAARWGAEREENFRNPSRVSGFLGQREADFGPKGRIAIGKDTRYAL